MQFEMPIEINRKLSQMIITQQQQLSAAIPPRIKSQWAALPARDRSALKILIAVLVLALFYLFLWQPVIEKVKAKQQWQTSQEERIERAQLAAYDRLNRFGMIDPMPVDLWLKMELPQYRLSLILHKASNNPKQPSQLQLRYSDARQAQAFLVLFSRFSQLSQVQVDQSKRTIALDYRLNADYAELIQ
jgi:hypothetical protein